MRVFMIEYTEDFGATYHTVIVNAKNSSEAYVNVDMTLSKDGAITSITEVI